MHKVWREDYKEFWRLNTLNGWTDIDWATDSRRSTNGYVFLLGGGAISWQSHKQAPIVFSSTNFEYIVVIIATKESMWLQQLLENTNFQQQGANILYYNNQSCLSKESKIS